MSSLWRRVKRLAEANINDFKERAFSPGSGRSLEEMSDDELKAELERRRKEHAERAQSGERRPAEAPRPRASSPSIGVDLSDLSPDKRRKFRQYYANLELPFGSDLAEVKQAYRRLMRQYHPDKHQNDPARRQLATQLSQKLTVAYNELSQNLKNRKKV